MGSIISILTATFLALLAAHIVTSNFLENFIVTKDQNQIIMAIKEDS